MFRKKPFKGSIRIAMKANPVNFGKVMLIFGILTFIPDNNTKWTAFDWTDITLVDRLVLFNWGQ